MVSIIIPTFNEVETIGLLIKRLEELPFGKEIIVVDDGSTDGTVEVVRKLMREYDNVRLVLRGRKMGIGSAYKDGFKLAKGNVIVQMDADMSHDPGDLPGLLRALRRSDLVIGSRYIPGGRIVNWPLHRRLISYGANLLAKLLLGLKVHDATSGFRAYRRSAFEKIVSFCLSSGFDFQVEAVFVASILGLRVAESPIRFTGRTKGRSKLGLRDILNFIVFLIMLRKRGQVIRASYNRINGLARIRSETRH